MFIGNISTDSSEFVEAPSDKFIENTIKNIMQINIKTSEQNQIVVKSLTTKLPYGTKENVIARIALGYSLQTGKSFKQLISIYMIQKEKNIKTILF